MDLISAPKGFKPASQERLDALYAMQEKSAEKITQCKYNTYRKNENKSIDRTTLGPVYYDILKNRLAEK